MKEIIIQIPLPYYKKKSKAIFTLNVYRNAHYHLLNSFKSKYGLIIRDELKKQKKKIKFKQLEINYVLILPSNRKRNIDLCNVMSVVDKVAQDVFVKEGLIQDDGYKYVKRVSFEFGGFDKDNKGFIEIILKEYIRK